MAGCCLPCNLLIINDIVKGHLSCNERCPFAVWFVPFCCIKGVLWKGGRPQTAVILFFGLWIFNIIINFADRYLAAVRACSEERHRPSRLNIRPSRRLSSVATLQTAACCVIIKADEYPQASSCRDMIYYVRTPRRGVFVRQCQWKNVLSERADIINYVPTMCGGKMPILILR